MLTNRELKSFRILQLHLTREAKQETHGQNTNKTRNRSSGTEEQRPSVSMHSADLAGCEEHGELDEEVVREERGDPHPFQE